jgi:nicotinamidase-related amidase
MTAPTIERIDPARTALLVMDYQRATFSQFPAAGPLLARARDTIELVRSRGAAIGYVRVAFADGEAPGGRMAQLVTAEVLPMLGADAPGTQIHDQVAPQDKDIIVRKVRVGPFGTTDLDEQLRARGIDTLLLAGLTTSGVVLSAVRDGHDRDYRLIVLADLTADPDQEVHDFLLRRIFPRQAEVISSADLSSLLR